MNREQMADVIAEKLTNVGRGAMPYPRRKVEAVGILDAILPQVTTVEELEALPDRTRLVGVDGDSVQKFNGYVRVDARLWAGASTADKAIRDLAPLTVVYTP